MIDSPAHPATRKVTLITGCSSGIGLATAELLARGGHTLYVTARREESLAELRQRFADAAHVIVCPLDLTSSESVEAAAQRVSREQSRLDVLINNAGYGQFGAVEDVMIDQWRDQFETNLFGIVRTTQAFLPLLRAAAAHRPETKARIINVSSAVAHLTTPLMGVYNASKHALRSASAALRMEVGRWGIDIIEVEPGFIATNFRQNVKKRLEGSSYRTALYRDVYEAFERRWLRLTQGKMTQPADVARAIVRAVDARKPRACYRVTMAAKVSPFLPVLLPQRILSWALIKTFGVGATLGRRVASDEHR